MASGPAGHNNGSIVEVEGLLHRYNVREFLKVALASGPVPVRDLEMRAVAVGLLLPDVKISQCKAFRRTADTLGVRRFQMGRCWHWTLDDVAARRKVSTIAKHKRRRVRRPRQTGAPKQAGLRVMENNASIAEFPAPAADQVSANVDNPKPEVASGKGVSAAASDRSSAIAGPDFARMTKQEFIAWSIANQPALASASMAKSKVTVARYLETGDLADLFPER
jgi:hypothetical protein